MAPSATSSNTDLSTAFYLLPSIHLRAPAAQFGLLLLSIDSQIRPKGSSVLPLLLQREEGLMKTRAALPVFDALGFLILENIPV